MRNRAERRVIAKALAKAAVSLALATSHKDLHRINPRWVERMRRAQSFEPPCRCDWCIPEKRGRSVAERRFFADDGENDVREDV